MTSDLFRAVLLSVAMLAVPFSANAITVDGDLADLIAASSDPDVGATASESGADGEGYGFDITNMYLYYDVSDSTLYAGFQVAGTVGDECGPGPIYPGGLCNIPTFRDPLFDSTDNYGIQVDVGNLVFDAGSIDAAAFPIVGLGTGEQSGSVGGVSYFVSETNNGVEFGITGLGLDFSHSNPLDISIRFTAGSATNPGPEDEAFIATTLVPIPAAAWLFGSGLLGLMAIRRRHKAAE